MTKSITVQSDSPAGGSFALLLHWVYQTWSTPKLGVTLLLASKEEHSVSPQPLWPGGLGTGISTEFWAMDLN